MPLGMAVKRRDVLQKNVSHHQGRIITSDNIPRPQSQRNRIIPYEY